MANTVKLWLHGLVAAVIGGGASAVTASVSASLIAPDKFNLSGQLVNFFELAGISFIINGFLSAMAYLKQSPIPSEEEAPTVEVGKGASA